MSQCRKGKGLSLGQTVKELRAIRDAGQYGEWITGVVVASLYHIEKLRGKLNRLNLKIQRETKSSKHIIKCNVPFSFCLDCMYHNVCVREDQHMRGS